MPPRGWMGGDRVLSRLGALMLVVIPVAAATADDTASTGAATASAAAPPATAAANGANGSQTQLAEVVVTATKREQSVRKIPETVDVLKGKDLEEIGAREMEDYLRYVPGITLQEGEVNSGRTISIRGIGPEPGANTTVGVLVDDVSVGDPYLSYLVPDIDPYDVKDIEVLKGPQGTLFGAQALNGALRYVLNKPLLDTWEARGFVDGLHIQAHDSGETFGGAVNVPLGQHAALRAVDLVQEVPGLYRDVNANGKDIPDADKGYKRMYRMLGTWELTDHLSATAFYIKQVSHRNDLSLANNLNGDFVRTDTPGPSTSTQRVAVMNLDLRYTFDWATLISETSRNAKQQLIDYDVSAFLEDLAVRGVQSVRTYSLINSNTISQELRLVSTPGDGPWAWIVGAYYDHYNANVTDNEYVAQTADPAQVVTGLGLPASLISSLFPSPQGLSVLNAQFLPLGAKEESLFGELTRKLFDRNVELTLGGRFYRESLLTDISLAGLLAVYGEAEGFSGVKTEKNEGFNPKLSATWQVASNVLWYATGAHGFQFGGLNAPAAIPTDNVYPLAYKPSTIWSYETGVRNDFFGKRLQFDICSFLINWKDLQIQQATPSGSTTFTENIGAARSKGLESSIRWLTPIPGVTFINSASYIRAKVAEPYTTSTGVFIPAGFDLPAAPRLQTASTLSWAASFGSLRPSASVTLTHEGPAFNDIEHDRVIFRYNTVNVNLGLTLPYLPMAPALTINGTNLTNSHAVVGSQTNHEIDSALGGFDLAAFVRPRTVDVRLTAQF